MRGAMTRCSTMLALTVSALLAAAPLHAQGADEVVATVGGTEIKASDIRQLLETVDPAQRKLIVENKDTLSQLVRQEAERLSVVKAAEAANWPSKPDAAFQLKRARDAAVAQGYIASLVQVPDTYPSEEELKQAYEQNKAQLLKPAQYKLQDLQIELPNDPDKALLDRTEAMVQDVIKRAREKNAVFEKLAQPAKGNDPAIVYKDLGFVAEDKVAPEARPVVQGLNIGEVSPAFRLPNGWHVLRVVDLKPRTPYSFAEVRDTLADTLRRRRIAAEQQAELQKITQSTPVAVNEIALRRLFK